MRMDAADLIVGLHSHGLTNTQVIQQQLDEARALLQQVVDAADATVTAEKLQKIKDFLTSRP